MYLIKKMNEKKFKKNKNIHIRFLVRGNVRKCDSAMQRDTCLAK